VGQRIRRCLRHPVGVAAGREELHLQRDPHVGSGLFEVGIYKPGALDPTTDNPIVETFGASYAKTLKIVPTTTGAHSIVVKFTSGSGFFRISYPGSSFGLDSAAYKFPNYSGYADVALFKSVFGLGSGSLSNVASVYYDVIFEHVYGGGQCFGWQPRRRCSNARSSVLALRLRPVEHAEHREGPLQAAARRTSTNR